MYTLLGVLLLAAGILGLIMPYQAGTPLDRMCLDCMRTQLPAPESLVLVGM